ncbi:TMV resistance protein N isoform X2 [Arachis ipaensis]|uniref:disease resistance protein RUN1-like n=1 Tax=Arachis hypogaea TaxID=3818 RepID=UPI000A2B4A4D|nr:TMV resistance protein N isoform X2 [Arachis ipaensis]
MDCMRIQSTLSHSHSKNWKYDVFVSFRGDTRFNFTDHLCAALRRHGILAFRDDTRLEKGGPISAGLLQAIEGSQVLIVVFSMNYASSKWCLQELAKIADCINIPGHRVLPVFCDVSPSEVRKQSGNYEKAFVEHEERFKKDAEMMEQVRRWRAALTQVASLSGWDLKDKSHSAEIEKIVKTVTKILGPRSSSSLSNDIVGMEFPLQKLGKLLVLDSDDDVRVVGICGMGGIGKTTLASRLYEKISYQYDVSCFMDDVSKTYRDCGSLGMKKQLLCPAFMEEDSLICNILMADNLIENMLHDRKVLIVLDNVDQRIQLEKLALKREWLGRGSRIIIVSRDEHILTEYGADEVFKVPLLNDENALQLFCRKAFKCNHVAKDYEGLTDSALAYANGLPLAIKVLGSFLFGRDVSEWSSALVRLKETPTKDIMDVLRISFDGLEDPEKEIFLDIACFFPNDIENYVKDILRIRGFHPDNGIKVLIEKSLITRDRWKITMHDLLRDLGRSIVREKSPKKPRKWSRLWNHKDLSNVLRENKPAENVEAIVLPTNDEIREELSLKALSKMSRLKLLKLGQVKVNFSGKLHFLSNELGYLSWKEYPFTCLPSRFQPTQLVKLILRYSNVKELWKGIKYCKQLKWLPSTLLPIGEGSHGRLYYGGIFVFNCPNLSDTESCGVTVISWMIKMIQVNMQSSSPRCVIQVVIPGTEIPRWFNNQNEGSSMKLDPSPILNDNNWIIGIACCVTFVVHDTPTQLPEEPKYPGDLGCGFRLRSGGSYFAVPIRLKKDLITTELDHMLLIFFSRDRIIDHYTSHLKEGRCDLDGIELATLSEYPKEIIQVKSCGYRWVCKEDLEQLNSTMMYSANSSTQNKKGKFLAIQ